MTIGDAAAALSRWLQETDHRGVTFMPVPGGAAIVAAAPSNVASLGSVEEPVLQAANPLLALFKAWFAGNPGRHNSTVFVISREPWNFDRVESFDNFEEWQSEAFVSLPPTLASTALTPEHYVAAALYVYEQQVVDGRLLLVQSGYSITQYLKDTGLYERIGLP